jgi:alpha-1,6-mannosyltransferase
VQQHGINPYIHAPSSRQLESLRDERIFPQINRQGHPTVYPAGAQLFFRLFHVLVGDSVSGFKAMMVVMELLTILVLILTLRASGFEEARVFLYAWNPLVIFEIGLGGHLDGLTVFLLVLSLYLAARNKRLPAVAALAFSSATKLYPVLLLPAFLNRGDRVKGTICFTGCFLLLYLPFFTGGEKIIGFLPDYFTSPYESFNLGIKYLIMDLMPSMDYFSISKAFVLILIVSGLFVLFKEKQNTQVIRYCYIMIGLLIVLMPTALHPWYVVMLVPFLCFFPAVAWIIFTCMLPLSYIYYAPSMHYLPVWVSLLEYGPLFLLLIGGALKQYASRRRAHGILPKPGAESK